MDNTLTPQATDYMAEATLIAGFALKGFTVHRAQDGYLVSRWGMTRHCPSFQTLTAFAKQVGVPL
jgi:hypothetical protein